MSNLLAGYCSLHVTQQVSPGIAEWVGGWLQVARGWQALALYMNMAAVKGLHRHLQKKTRGWWQGQATTSSWQAGNPLLREPFPGAGQCSVHRSVHIRMHNAGERRLQVAGSGRVNECCDFTGSQHTLGKMRFWFCCRSAVPHAPPPPPQTHTAIHPGTLKIANIPSDSLSTPQLLLL